MPIIAKHIIVKNKPQPKEEVQKIVTQPEPEHPPETQEQRGKEEVKKGLFAHKSSKFLDDMLKN